MGRADILFRFLELAGLNHPAVLDRYTEELDTSPDAPPVVVQVADRILAENDDMIPAYQQAWDELHESNPYAETDAERRNVAESIAFARFMKSWIKLERLLEVAFRETRNDSGGRVPATSRSFVKLLIEEGLIESQMASSLDRLRVIRNELVHGRTFPEVGILSQAADELEALNHVLEDAIGAGQGS